MKILLLFLVFLSTFASLNAQNKDFKCPWNEVDCPGKCGRFYDADGDGFCDYGIVTKKETPETTAVADPVQHNTTVKQNQNIAETIDTQSIVVDTFVADTTTQKTVIEESSNDVPTKSRGYNLIWITTVILILYILTSVLQKRKIIRKFIHRRIWNVSLAITFLTSGTLGIILVIQINYNLATDYILSYLYWHVQFGIAMAVIAFIHLLWHFKYYKMLFAPRSKADCEDA